MQLLKLFETDFLIHQGGRWLTAIPDELSPNAIIIFHGYGANAWDLASLASMYSQNPENKAEFTWIFPQGPLGIDGPFGEMSSRAWFPIAIERLISTQHSGGKFLEELPIEGRAALLTSLNRFFRSLHSKGVEKIALAGFSQGGMLAYHLAPTLLKYLDIEVLALFSSVSIDEKSYTSEWGKLNQPAVELIIQSHGTADDILSIEGAHQLHQKLEPYAKEYIFKNFNQGHTIPEHIIQLFFSKLQSFNC